MLQVRSFFLFFFSFLFSFFFPLLFLFFLPPRFSSFSLKKNPLRHIDLSIRTLLADFQLTRHHLVGTGSNISATPFDLTAGSFPYPSGAASGLNPSTPAALDNPSSVDNIMDVTDWANPNTEMWYLPPGPAFFQNMENGGIAMTAEGLNVGGVDLLEYMAMDPQFPVMDNPPFP